MIKPPLPLEIQEAVDILGISHSQELTQQIVHSSWRRHICSPEVHPDLGGNTERAILLNTAKDLVLKWLHSNEPKLGKLFTRSGNSSSGSAFNQKWTAADTHKV